MNLTRSSSDSALPTVTLAALAIALLSSPGCETFDGPPEPYLPDAQGGLLSDPAAPLRIKFTKPIDPATLKLSLVPLEVDAQDRLSDERGVPDTDIRVLNPLFIHNPAELSADFNGSSTLAEDNTLFTATLKSRLPVGQRLTVLVEPGLANTTNGLTLNVRRRLSFALDFKCSNKGTSIAKSGPYFFLLNVETPLALQVQLYAWLEIDPVTGAFVGQFSNADRLPNAGKCPAACTGVGEVCQTSPAPACVLASEKARGVDDYVDFFPQEDPVLGYGVTVQGCLEDQDGQTAALATAPANLGIKSPPIAIDALTVVSVFKADERGVLRGTGAGAADNARLGTGNLGRAAGTVLGRSLSDTEAPANIPRPPSAP